MDAKPTITTTNTTIDPDSGAGAETAIRQLVASAQEHQSDVEPFVALHTDSTVVVNIAGRRVLDRSELHAAMVAALASPLADVVTTIDVQDVRFVRPDVAIVSCVKQVIDRRSSEATGAGRAELPASGSLTYVLVADAEHWRIALAQTTPISI